MQDDTVVWQIINHSFCSFKASVARERTFCQNPYNVTGLCLRSACPLANSRYATIKEEDGQTFLYMKTAERAHSPKNLWEKIKLPANYTKALEMISEKLEYFPKYLVHRNKQRLTKIHQMIIRMRKLKLQAKPIIVPINTRMEQREKGRERKALQAAQLEKSIEVELLERLRAVANETEIYNYPEMSFNKALGKASKAYTKEGKLAASSAAAAEGEEEEEEEEGEEEQAEGEYEYDDEEDEEGVGEVEYVEDFNPSDDEEDDEGDYGSGGDDSEGEGEGDEDIEDAAPMTKEQMLEMYKSIEAKRNKRKNKGGKTDGNGKKQKVEIEYEYEDEEEGRMNASLTKAATAFNSKIRSGKGSSSSSSAAAVSYNF